MAGLKLLLYEPSRHLRGSNQWKKVAARLWRTAASQYPGRFFNGNRGFGNRPLSFPLQKIRKIFAENQEKIFKKIGWQILFGLIFYIIILIGLIFSFSRNGWLGLALAGFLFLLYSLKQKNKTNLFCLLKLALISTLIFASLFSITKSRFWAAFRASKN